MTHRHSIMRIRSLVPATLAMSFLLGVIPHAAAMPSATMCRGEVALAQPTQTTTQEVCSDRELWRIVQPAPASATGESFVPFWKCYQQWEANPGIKAAATVLVEPVGNWNGTDKQLENTIKTAGKSAVATFVAQTPVAAIVGLFFLTSIFFRRKP